MPAEKQHVTHRWHQHCDNRMPLQNVVQPAIQQRMQDLQGHAKRHENYLRFRQSHLKIAQDGLRAKEQRINEQQRFGQSEVQKLEAAITASQKQNAEMLKHSTQRMV